MNFNIINPRHSKTLPAVLTLLLATSLGSCSLIYDDLQECAERPKTSASVNFVYDYNIDEVDRFAEHIGAVTLYVFDATGKLITQIEQTSNTHGITDPSFSIPLELPYGNYTLYASARENADGYEASLNTKGAKFRRNAFESGKSFGELFYTLDHQNGEVDHGGEMLEHFWLTRQPSTLTLTEAPVPEEGAPQPDDIVIPVTVPLQRVTNNLHVNILRADNKTTRSTQSISTSDYDVWIATAEGRDRLDLAGETARGAVNLKYNPVKSENSSTESGEPCIDADFSTSRIFHKGDSSKHDRLYIKSNISGETFDFDLPEYLSKGRDAYAEKGWSTQEYLDREYDYNIKVEFNEKDDDWRYIEISIATLSWAKRIQNEKL